MRRLLAIALLAVFGLPLATPLLALGTSGEAGLPACCRRTGQHHCGMPAGEQAMTAAPGAAKAPTLAPPEERCPYCPATPQGTARLDLTFGPPAGRLAARPGLHPIGVAHTESRRPAVCERTRDTRGPPSIPLLA